MKKLFREHGLLDFENGTLEYVARYRPLINQLPMSRAGKIAEHVSLTILQVAGEIGATVCQRIPRYISEAIDKI